MIKMNILKPTSANFQTFLYIGSGLIFISIFDVILRSFFNLNFLTFLPGIVNTLFPLIIGLIGLQMIRLEYSGNRLVDKINQNINNNTFNAASIFAKHDENYMPNSIKQNLENKGYWNKNYNE